VIILIKTRFKVLINVMICLILIFTFFYSSREVYAANSLVFEGKTFNVVPSGDDNIVFYVDGVKMGSDFMTTWEEYVLYDAYVQSVDNVSLLMINNEFGIPIPTLSITWTQGRRTGSFQSTYQKPIPRLITGSFNSPTFSTNGNMISIVFPSDVIHKKFRLGSGPWQNYVSPITTTERIEAVGADKFGRLTGVGYFQKLDPPQIQLSLSTSRLTQLVKIKVVLIDPIGISEKRYALGNYSAEYMSQSSNANVKDYYYDEISVIENGIYTIYAKNKAGIMSVKTITISNIDRIAPLKPIFSVTPTLPSYDVNISINYPSDSLDNKYRIGSGIWKYYAGSFSLSYNTKIEALAIDAAGNESEISTYEIKNIKPTYGYEYDENGQLIRLESKSGSYKYHYDDNENLIKVEKIQ